MSENPTDRAPENPMEPPVASITRRNQRIVLEHTTGPYAGLHQILGHSDEFEGQDVPVFIPAADILPYPRQAAVSLVASTPRFLLYREIFPPKARGFHKDQR